MTRFLSTSLSAICVIIVFSSCQKDEDAGNSLDSQLEQVLNEAATTSGYSFFILPASDDFASIPQDPKNAINAAKVALGRHLYHETGLAIKPKKDISRQTYSCASCHHAAAGFQAGRQQGLSEGGLGYGQAGEGRVQNEAYLIEELDIQPIRTPSAMNGAWQANTLWNGQFGATHLNTGTEARWTEDTPKAVNKLGFEGLETQAIAGLTVHRMGIEAEFCEQTDYKKYFEEAFPGLQGEDLYTLENTGLAIAAYERTLLSNQAPFQQWLRGNKKAMFDDEKEGAILFFGKANCVECHTGPALNKMEFYALGMNDLDGPGVYGPEENDPVKLGRGGFTGNPEDNFKYKVPQLYNLKDSPFLGHGGNFKSVREVIQYKNQAVAQNSEVPASQLAPEFIPLNLNDEEINQLTRFVENALHDPDLDRYLPQALPSGFCFPNNDLPSRNDRGCN